MSSARAVGDHLRRRVDALDRGRRPARGEQRGQRARPAAEIDHPARRSALDPRDQVEERAGRARPAKRPYCDGIPSHACQDISTSRDSMQGVDDEVDEIVAAWRRERPDLDVEPLQVLSRISRLAAVLDERRADAFVGHGAAGLRVRRAVGAAAQRRAVRAHRRRAGHAHARHVRHDDQPARPARRARLRHPAPRPDRRPARARAADQRPDGSGSTPRSPNSCAPSATCSARSTAIGGPNWPMPCDPCCARPKATGEQSARAQYRERQSARQSRG